MAAAPCIGTAALFFVFYRLMFTIFSFISPTGTWTSTTSPFFLFNNALAIGNFTEIFLSLVFASCGLTIV